MKECNDDYIEPEFNDKDVDDNGNRIAWARPIDEDSEPCHLCGWPLCDCKR